MAKDKRFIEGTNMMLKGCSVKWAHLKNPDTKYEHKWCVDAYLSDDDAAELKTLGFNVKDGEDGPFIKVNRKCMTKAGKKLSPPVVVGPDPSVPFEEDIGNGSICNILVWAKYWAVKGETGISASLDKVQVVNHVAYEGGGDSFEDVS